MRKLRLRLSPFILLIAVTTALYAAPPVDYYVTLVSSKLHVVHVRIHLAGTSGERDVQLPAWNALYQIRDFAQNVRSVHAHDDRNVELPVRKLDKTTWRVSHAESGAEVEYDIYLDQPGPFGAQYNSEHAFLNLAQVLMYPLDARDSQMTVTFIGLPERWQVATSLESLRPGVASARGIFVARNYDRLVDAPIELGTFHETSFDANGATFHIAVDADPADYSMSAIEDMVRKVVTAEMEWMDDKPFGQYLFIYHFPHGLGAGGMEHAYSTAIEANADRIKEDPVGLAATTAHEFFHLWNVKRIRPATLEPIDYVHENYTRALWFSEGVTSTVADYALLRAGVSDERRFLNDLSHEIATLQKRPAHRTQTVEDSSLDTWFDKYPQYRLPERSISYYNKGEILGVLLDLAIRDHSKGTKSLRDLLRWMNKTYAYGSRYFNDTDGVREGADAVSGADMQMFFRKYVSGLEELPYNELLQRVGLRVVEQHVVTPYAGFISVRNFDVPPVTVYVEEGSEAEKAGLVQGDTILSVNGKPLNSEYEDVLATMRPGEMLKLKVAGRKGNRKVEFPLSGREQVEYRVADLDNVTAAQRARRAAWLSSQPERRAESATGSAAENGQ
jgi:predicted metalloprotease with PDZ domain